MEKSKFILLFLLLGQLSFAQLYITTGTSFNANDAIKISIQEMGFVNDGSFSANNSTFLFKEVNGTMPLEIGGTSSISFNHITIDVQNQNVVLANDIDVEGNVTFNSGLFDLDAFDLSLGNNGEVLGESDGNCFIGMNGGQIVKTVNLSNPVNVNPANLGAIISSPENLGTTIIRRGHEVQTGTNGGFSIERFYEISPTNNTGLNATLRFHYFDGELNGIPENELELWRNDGSNWTKEGFTSRDAVNNYVELTGIDAFSTWTLTNDANALPVELLTFLVQHQEDRKVLLSWETASESNNRGFEIQHSTTATHWKSIGFVAGAGNASTKKRYEFVDENSAPGLNYYRLRQLDFDGQFSFSPIRVVAVEKEDAVRIGAIFPNPVSSLKNYMELPVFNSINDHVWIQVFDNLGQSIYQTNQVLEIGHQQIKLPLRRMSSGVYHLHIKTNHQSWSRKIMVE